MAPNEAGRFNEILTGLCRVYGREPDRLVLDAYWLALRSWSLPEVEEAVGALLRSSVHMPRPADFVTLRRQAEGDTLSEIWQRVCAHARSLYNPQGYVDQPMGDGAIDAAVACIGGYPAIAECKAGELHFLERHFAERYREVIETCRSQAALPSITKRRLGGPQRALASPDG